MIRNETVWLAQKALEGFFRVKVSAVSKHLMRIFASGEMTEAVVASRMGIPASDGNAIRSSARTASI
jgi:hypothetical protein